MLGLRSSLLAGVPGVSHGFFGRIGGTSPAPWASLNTSHDVSDSPARVDENLARVRFQVGLRREHLFSATQVHGREVVCITSDDDVDAVRARSADALLTDVAERGVGVRTADCAPILCAVDDGSAVAAIHAGWRGAVGGVIQATIDALCVRRGVAPTRIVAAVGPCIGVDAFEVGPEVIEAARVVVPSSGHDALWRSSTRADRADRFHLDLGGLCLHLLQQAGVARSERVGPCTVAHVAHYFSHRADNGVTGRQMSVIAKTSPPDLDDEAFR